jgi:predicted DNA-binding transcriptional regulator YafY
VETMQRTENQKMKLLCLMKLLVEKTDEDHPLTIAQIINELAKNNIHAERKSIYADLEALRQYGLDVTLRKSKTTGYFVASRTFELPELKLLADAVACSRFITEKKSKQLIQKIESLTSCHEAKQIQRQVYVNGRVKNANEKIYYNVDSIHQAISQKKQISFRYFEYTVDKEKEYRHDGELYYASPYALSWDNQNYYLIAYYERYQKISHFRVDKMENIQLLETPARELPDGGEFDVAEYSRKLFGMFGGEEERIRLQFDNSLIGVVLDRFGMDADIKRADEQSFIVTFRAFVSPTLLGWIFEFAGKVRVLEPESLKQKLCRKAEECLKLNSGGAVDTL